MCEGVCECVGVCGGGGVCVQYILAVCAYAHICGIASVPGCPGFTKTEGEGLVHSTCERHQFPTPWKEGSTCLRPEEVGS